MCGIYQQSVTKSSLAYTGELNNIIHNNSSLTPLLNIIILYNNYEQEIIGKYLLKKGGAQR